MVPPRKGKQGKDDDRDTFKQMKLRRWSRWQLAILAAVSIYIIAPMLDSSSKSSQANNSSVIDAVGIQFCVFIFTIDQLKYSELLFPCIS